jgi:hypothetical protein
MKKSVQIIILLITVFAILGISGCLGNDDVPDADSDNLSSDPASSTPASGAAGKDLEYSTSIVTISDLPAGFEFLSTQSVKSHGEGIGISDVLQGYRGYYTFTNSTVSNSTVYFYCFKTNTNNDADRYLQDMKTSYTNSYGSPSTVSSVRLNGHDAVKFVSVDEDVSDMTAWTRDNFIFVVKGRVSGEIDYETLESLAVASGL